MGVPINQSGMSLIEVMTAMVIAFLSFMAFFQLFAFGSVEVEKLGYRREALGLLKGEMEFWRARFQAAAASDKKTVPPAEGELRKRSVQNAGGMVFMVDPEVDSPSRDRDLRYQRIRVRVSYSQADLVDTLELETRQYVR
ncbi:MAG: prepilin-type N-terminal cleavage/methylation domain-containing protein [Fibrobacteria bacterium]